MLQANTNRTRPINRPTAVTFAAIALAVVVFGSAEACPPHYTVQIIQGPPCQFGTPTRGLAVNEQSQVVGFYTVCSVGHDKGYLWKPDTGFATLVPPIGITDSIAYDIANVPASGGPALIVGEMYGSNQLNEAFVLKGNQWTIIPPPPRGLYSAAFAVNNAGVVVGYETTPDTYEAFMWQNGEKTVLSPPFGPNAIANNVSQSGAVIGWMGVSVGPGSEAHGFIWQDGKVTDMGVFPGSTIAEPKAINTPGQIVGRMLLPSPDGPGGLAARAFLWSAGEWTDLGILPGYIQTFAMDINDAGDTVGSCSLPNFNERAILWHNGVILNLNTLIPPDSGVIHLYRANGINNAGQIACTAQGANGDVVGVLLTPVPSRIGDVNCNGIVNVDDLLGVINAWGQCPSEGNCSSDLNGDGAVSLPDLLIVLNNWG